MTAEPTPTPDEVVIPVAPAAAVRCPDCHAVLLVVMDPADPGLPAELATKVDGHRCEAAGE